MSGSSTVDLMMMKRDDTDLLRELLLDSVDLAENLQIFQDFQDRYSDQIFFIQIGVYMDRPVHLNRRRSEEVLHPRS